MTTHISLPGGFTDIPESGLLQEPLATSLSGETQTWTKELHAGTDDSSSVGLWQVAPGRSRWHFADYSETIHIIDGELIAIEDGQEPLTFTAGDVVVFHRGWSGEWDIPRGLKKLYFVYP